MFRKLFSKTTLSCKRKYLRSMSNAAMLLFEPRKKLSAQVHMLSSQASLVLLSTMRLSASALLLFPNTMQTVGGENQSSFTMSARFRFGSRFRAAKSQVSRLSTIGSLAPGYGSERYEMESLLECSKREPWCKLRRHRWRNKGRFWVEWRDRANWPHAKSVVANCICNFCHI